VQRQVGRGAENRQNRAGTEASEERVADAWVEMMTDNVHSFPADWRLVRRDIVSPHRAPHASHAADRAFTDWAFAQVAGDEPGLGKIASVLEPEESSGSEHARGSGRLQSMSVGRFALRVYSMTIFVSEHRRLDLSRSRNAWVTAEHETVERRAHSAPVVVVHSLDVGEGLGVVTRLRRRARAAGERFG
jgi:hypothetical protein